MLLDEGVSGRRGRRFGRVITVVLLSLGALYVLLPILWLLSTALRRPTDAFSIPPAFLAPLTLSNFQHLFQSEFLGDLGHSLILTTLSTVVALVAGVPGGYAFARARFPGQRLITAWLIGAYITPALVFMVPLYVLYQQLGLSGSYVSMMLFYETGLLPFTVFLMRSYFVDVPRELDEAGIIDGCTRFQAFWRVVLPVALPGVAAVTILVAIAAWGEYFGALIFSNESTVTAPVAIQQYIGLESTDWSTMAAGGLCVVIPVVLLTAVVQRGFVRGLSGGMFK
jgi:multiple sugar transport system permease protein